MDENRFAIVFTKLAEGQSGPEEASQVSIRFDTDPLAEMREIDELRRFAMEVAEPRPMLFTRS